MGEPEKVKHRNESFVSRSYWGTVIVLIGFYFLGENYNWFGLGWDLSFHKIWPAFLIILGISYVIKFMTSH
jgi:hypothetical protein